jgi:hypothetical protein
MMQPMRILAAAAGILLFCAGIPGFAQAPPYRLVPGWGALPHGAPSADVPGMAIAASGRIGNIYVGETVPGTTLTGQPGGHLVRKLQRVK